MCDSLSAPSHERESNSVPPRTNRIVEQVDRSFHPAEDDIAQEMRLTQRATGYSEQSTDSKERAVSTPSAGPLAEMLLAGNTDVSQRMRETKDLFEAACSKNIADVVRVLQRISESEPKDRESNTSLEAVRASHYSDIISQVKDGNGRNVLHFACTGGNLEIIKFLIEMCPAIVHEMDNKGENSLFIASKLENAAAAQFLIQKGASLQPTLPDGLSPLHCAVISRNKDVCQALLDAGADVNTATTSLGPPLNYAIFSGDTEIATLLLRHGANPNLNDPSLGLPSALTFSCDAGNLQMCEQLLEHGADPNLSTNEMDCGALHSACDRGLVQIIKLLLQFGADPDLKIQNISAAEMARERPELQEVLSSSGSRRKGVAADSKGTLSTTVLELKLRGNELFSQQQYEKADDLYAQALQIMPLSDLANRSVLFSNRCHCLVKAGQARKAIEFGIRAVAANSKWAKAHYRLAVAYQEDNQLPMSLKNLSAALHLDPANKEIERKRKIVTAEIVTAQPKAAA